MSHTLIHAYIVTHRKNKTIFSCFCTAQDVGWAHKQIWTLKRPICTCTPLEFSIHCRMKITGVITLYRVFVREGDDLGLLCFATVLSEALTHFSSLINQNAFKNGIYY